MLSSFYILMLLSFYLIYCTDATCMHNEYITCNDQLQSSTHFTMHAIPTMAFLAYISIPAFILRIYALLKLVCKYNTKIMC